MRHGRGRMTKRERALKNNAAHRFYASCSERPDAQANLEKVLVEVPPLRHRVKRPVDQQPVVPLEKDIQKAILQAIELRQDIIFVGRFNRGQAVATNGYGETRYTQFNTVKGFPDIHGL